MEVLRVVLKWKLLNNNLIFITMKENTKEGIIWVVLILLFVAAATFGACMANAAPVPASGQVVATVKVDSTRTTSAPVKVGQIKIQHADGRVEVRDLYRGARGGYFYYTGKTDKNGKPVKKYLTKKEKEENKLK